MPRILPTTLCLAALLLLLPGHALAASGGLPARYMLAQMGTLVLLGFPLLALALKWRLNPSWGRVLVTALRVKLLSTVLGAVLVWVLLRLPTWDGDSPWTSLAGLALWFGLALAVEIYHARDMLRQSDPRRVRNAVILANTVCFGFLAGVSLIPWVGKALLS